ncbi:MAG: 50S ribosomal protein L19e [Thermoplasmata archaeon]|jgi:large subunit ribosomal protein L19e|nr:50S ribosomal protein L19e [Thermoplasmata archaeon]MCI4359084.1 50S ribosomal protein L19e [Thermoplasmata archaeon]
MPDLSNQRRMASLILKCGEGRVWIDPASQEEIADAVTRSDVRSAIKAGVIRAKAIQGTSRARAKRHAREVAKGRHRGAGSRRGTPRSRVPKKERWMARIRAQRELLAELRDGKKITRSAYRSFYRHAKGGMYRSRAHLLLNLRLAGALPEAKP